jgi:3-hydroxyisobutyrate dehydrogenase
MKIAFIGLGNMGGPMALNLHRAKHTVNSFDVSETAVTRWRNEGLKIAGSAAESVFGAEVVITMLPASQHVDQLFFGGGAAVGLLDSIDAGALVIDCSTIASSTSKKLSEAAAKRNIAVLDAPVSGGTTGAVAATLTFMVGGAVQDLERARPLLEHMGKNIFHAGAAGAGQTAKICNNMLLAILMIGTSEALALGVANGLDPVVLSEIMKRSSGGNWALEKYNPMPGVLDNTPASRAYQGGFGTDLMVKDLSLAQDNATGNHVGTPLGGLARSLYAAHSLNGAGALDFSSIFKMFHK